MDPTPDTRSDADALTLRASKREQGTRIIAGKPYHYGHKGGPDGPLVLLPGPDPRTAEFDFAEGL